MLEKKPENLGTIVMASTSAIIVSSAIFHALHTNILPITHITAGIFLLFPAALIGIINEELKDSLISMVLSLIGTLIVTAFTRSIPAILRIFPNQNDLYIFQQITETLPLIFLMTPFFVIGTAIGAIFNEAFIRPKYQTQLSKSTRSLNNDKS